MPANLKETALAEKVEQAALEIGVTHGEFMNTLKRLFAVYQDKGDNLLNGTSIQKVAEMPRFSSSQKP